MQAPVIWIFLAGFIYIHSYRESKIRRIQYRLLREGAKAPRRVHYGDAGLDLWYCPKDKDPDAIFTLKNGQKKLLPTGVAFKIPKGWYGKILDRSGMATKEGLHTTFAGVIDSSYTGETHVQVYNLSGKDVQIMPQRAIGQIVFMEYNFTEPEEISKDQFEETTRGSNGFGSTG